MESDRNKRDRSMTSDKGPQLGLKQEKNIFKVIQLFLSSSSLMRHRLWWSCYPSLLCYLKADIKFLHIFHDDDVYRCFRGYTLHLNFCCMCNFPDFVGKKSCLLVTISKSISTFTYIRTLTGPPWSEEIIFYMAWIWVLIIHHQVIEKK